MLSRVTCLHHDDWLEAALRDPDRAVRETASMVLSWLSEASGPTVPPRELLPPDDACVDSYECAERALPGARGYEWEYTVEVWRTDGLQLGAYFVSTCQEDDRHARSIALGQAILANVGRRGDAFDPEHAATFIVDKQRTPRGATRA